MIGCPPDVLTLLVPAPEQCSTLRVIRKKTSIPAAARDQIRMAEAGDLHCHAGREAPGTGTGTGTGTFVASRRQGREDAPAVAESNLLRLRVWQFASGAASLARG